jgi:hypothetical protein
MFIQKTMQVARFRVFKLALLAISAVAAHAGVISFVGNLRTDANFTACGDLCTLGAGNTDGDYAQWAAFSANFAVPVTSTMTGISFSYGGGTNGNGALIAQNGFEPYLSLFDGSGNFLASTFFGTTCPVGANTNTDTQQCFDVLLDGGVLGTGNYSIAITAFENLSFAENTGSGTLADGFTGLGNLAPGEDLHYAFDVILAPTTTSPVPEPGSDVLLSGACLVWYLSTQKSKRTKS